MITIAQTKTAVGPNIVASFLASGGTGPYTYSVLAGGAGGSINASTGLYTAPAQVGSTPATLYDTIEATDSLSATATAKILVGSPILLFADIIQTIMGLDSNHIYLWDQKIFQPTDSGLYVILSVPSVKPFGSTKEYDGNGNAIQHLNVAATVDIDIISRGPAARDQKEQVLMALNSDYSETQQEGNGFFIAKISTNFIDLSGIDGAAIPYRYRISAHIQYATTVSQATPYFNTFSQASIATNP